MIYDANEKYIAVNNYDEIIEIYEIPKENENSKPASEEIKIGKNIFCKIKERRAIEELKLNPNYLNILLVGTLYEIKFFVIPETSQEKLIENPRFVFKKFFFYF